MLGNEGNVKSLRIFLKPKIIITLLSMFILAASFVLAEETSVPQGPDSLLVSDSGRHFNASAPKLLQAKAGNVSALVIAHTRVTEAWQGYYGNITGTITLDDADNFTLYNWNLPDPRGEIYASNGTNEIGRASCRERV